CPENWPEFPHSLPTCFHARLVKIVSKKVNAIRASQVVETIAIKISEHHAVGRLEKRTRAQVFAHKPAVLERHSIGVCELQIGNAFACDRRQPARFAETFTVELREPHKAAAAARSNLLRSPVRSEELVLVELIKWQQPGETPCYARMPGQRTVLGSGELESRFHLCQPRHQRGHSERVR